MPHVGRRGRVLLFFGSLDLVYAVSLTAPDAESRRTAFFTWLADIAPLWVWAIAWGGVGAVCVWQAFCRRDQAGYAAAVSLNVFWGLVSAAGWLFGGVERGYVSAAVWLGLAALVMVISGWPEERKGPGWTPASSQQPSQQ